MIIEKENKKSKKKKHKKDKSHKKHKKHKSKHNLEDTSLQDLEGVRAEIEACLKNNDSKSFEKVVLLYYVGCLLSKNILNIHNYIYYYLLVFPV